MVLEAVRQNGLAIRYAPKFQDNFAIGLTAVQNNGLARSRLDDELADNDLIKQIASKNLPKKLPKFLVNQEFISSKTNKMISRCVFLPDPETDPHIHPFYKKLKFAVESGFDTGIKFVFLEDEQACSFIRDFGVCLPQGEILIPYSPKLYSNRYLEKKLFAILPYSSKQELLENCIAFYGNGLKKTNTDELIFMAAEQGIPYKRGKTCIEGGNCIIYMQNGIEKAMIGEWSLYLSLFALKEQNFFNSAAEMEDIGENLPSNRAVRMARNLKIFKCFKKIQEDFDKIRDAFLDSIKNKIDTFYESLDQEIKNNDLLSSEEKRERLSNNKMYGLEFYSKNLEAFNGTEIAVEFNRKWEIYKSQLEAPVSYEDMSNHYIKAQKMDKYLRETMARISKELGIPLQHITFLPQWEFHIDMDVFVPPNGPVVLHDHGYAKEFLTRLAPFSNDINHMHKFIESADKLAKISRDVQVERERVLTEQKISYMRFPAAFSIPEKCQLNYCNGIFLGNKPIEANQEEKFAFLTTGPSYDFEMYIHNNFVELFKRTFPGIEILPVNGMSRFIDDNEGGIRCLTQECFNVAKQYAGAEKDLLGLI